MKYYLIAGEASGDLHASNLMKALKEEDPEAQFRFQGGDLMTAVGGERVKHYKEVAYMAFVPVLMHLKTILSNMGRIKRDIVAWQPDALILIDYPGFNLPVAKFIKSHTAIPVYYYISPKIWAWKEHRIKNIKHDVDELFSILPFEVDFYEKKHHYPIHYVGNPCVDAVTAYIEHHPDTREAFLQENRLDSRPIIALVAGSRKQEINDNLPKMMAAVAAYPQYQPVIAGAPSLDEAYYRKVLKGAPIPLLFGQTYRLLRHAHAALVTSGTATLETALFSVPQVVCYGSPMPKFYALMRRLFLKVQFISLVNLIAGKEIVRELVTDTMTVENARHELGVLLPSNSPERTAMLHEYDRMKQILGGPGASQRAAREIISVMKGRANR